MFWHLHMPSARIWRWLSGLLHRRSCRRIVISGGRKVPTMSKQRKKHHKSRAKQANGLPKGAYRLPNGNIMLPPVVSAPDKRGRRIRVEAELRAEPDVKQIARILVEMARARG